MSVEIQMDRLDGYIGRSEFEEKQRRAAEICEELLSKEDTEQVLGWRTMETSAVQLPLIKAKAEEIKRAADLFVIVGVGGSNQAARAMIEALKETAGADGLDGPAGADRPDGSAGADRPDGPAKIAGPEILYMGNTLSPHAVNAALRRMEGKSVYIQVIAKNFETLEPGSHFRVLRQWMSERYPADEMRKRIVVTGTVGSRLEEIAGEQGYLFLQFPVTIGGRYSAFSPVCLLPAAVAGLDVDAYLDGMRRAEAVCRNTPAASPAVIYGAARNLLYEKGYDIEMLASFEPRYAFFEKWWIQLFGESEGKGGKGIFPSAAIYTEDLHSIGQYMQEGRRNLLETFISVEDPGASLLVPFAPGYGDQFDYLDGMDFDRMNRAAEQATLEAHTAGGVPCIRFMVDEVSERSFGELYYYFMMACAVSGTLMGVNPFDQEGVEEYKRSMFAALGR